MRWVACLVVIPALTAACTGGQTGTPTSLRGAGPASEGCDARPQAETAIGIRGEEVWDLYSGMYTVVARARDYDDPNAQNGPPQPIAITIEPTDASLPEAAACGDLVVPVLVRIASEDGKLRERLIGPLYWGVTATDILLASDETPPRVSGSLNFRPEGLQFSLSIRTGTRYLTFVGENNDVELP